MCQNKAKVVGQLRGMLKISSLGEAKALVDTYPTTLVRGVAKDKASG